MLCLEKSLIAEKPEEGASLVHSQGEEEGGPSEVQMALVASEGATWWAMREWMKIAQAEKSHKKTLVCDSQTLPERT